MAQVTFIERSRCAAPLSLVCYSEFAFSSMYVQLNRCKTISKSSSNVKVILIISCCNDIIDHRCNATTIKITANDAAVAALCRFCPWKMSL